VHSEEQGELHSIVKDKDLVRQKQTETFGGEVIAKNQIQFKAA